MAKKKAPAKKSPKKKASKKKPSKEEEAKKLRENQYDKYCASKGPEFLEDQFQSQKSKKDAGRDYCEEYHDALEAELKRRM